MGIILCYPYPKQVSTGQLIGWYETSFEFGPVSTESTIVQITASWSLTKQASRCRIMMINRVRSGGYLQLAIGGVGDADCV